MPADRTPVWHCVGSATENTSEPATPSPAGNDAFVELTVEVVGVPGGTVPVDETSVNVALGTTLPCRATPASAPVVVYVATVVLPSGHVVTLVPCVDDCAHPPVPVDWGSA
jgi:hypothetical protein